MVKAFETPSGILLGGEEAIYETGKIKIRLHKMLKLGRSSQVYSEGKSDLILKTYQQKRIKRGHTVTPHYAARCLSHLCITTAFASEPNFFTLLNIYITKYIRIKNAKKPFHKYKNLQDI